jgi:hypothetical protein
MIPNSDPPAENALAQRELIARAMYHAKRSGFYFARGETAKQLAHDKLSEGYIALALAG